MNLESSADDLDVESRSESREDMPAVALTREDRIRQMVYGGTASHAGAIVILDLMDRVEALEQKLAECCGGEA